MLWEDSLRSRQDHVPGMGPHRVGMGDTNSGGDTSSGGHCTTQRTSVKLELLNSDAVSRPIEKNARVIQLCFDVIKHWVHFRFGRFGDELLFGTQHVLNVHFGSRPKWTCKVQTQGLCFCPTQIYDFPTLVWGAARMADQLDILRCVYSRFLASARGGC